MKYIKIPKKIINHYTYYFNQTMITYKIEVCYMHIHKNSNCINNIL